MKKNEQQKNNNLKEPQPIYSYKPKRYYIFMPFVLILPALLAGGLSWRKGLTFYNFETYAYLAVALLCGIMILFGFLRYRSEADLFDQIFRNYRRVALCVFLVCVFLAVFSYLPAFSEPVLFLAALVSISLGPALGFMIPGLLTLLLSMIMGYGIYHTMFLLMMIIIGSILDGEVLSGKTSRKWLVYDFLVFCIVSSFSVMFSYLENNGLENLNIIYAVCGALFSFILVMIFEAFLGRAVSKKDYVKLKKIMGDDFILRSQMRNFDKDFYERSSFISRCAVSVAAHIGADGLLTEAAGFYYRLGNLGDKESVDNGIDLALEYEFPGDLIWILYESRGVKRLPTTVPSGIVYIIENVISAFETNPSLKSQMDYELIVHKVTNKLSTEKKLDNCGISMNNFLTIRDDLLKWGVEYEHRFRK